MSFGPVHTYSTPGDGFGELALLYHTRRAASVRCKQDGGGGTVWALDRSDFREVLVRSEASHTLQVAGWLKTLPHFAPLSDAQRVKLAQNTESTSFAAGEVILREGDPTTPPHDGFYLLQSGEVVCHLPEKETDPSSPGGRTVVLRKLATPSSPRRASGDHAAVEGEAESDADAVLSFSYWQKEWDERRGRASRRRRLLGSSSGGIVLKAGSCFGEAAILRHKDRDKNAPPLLRQATVRAVGAVKALRLTAEKVDALLGPVGEAIERNFRLDALSMVPLLASLPLHEREGLLDRLEEVP